MDPRRQMIVGLGALVAVQVVTSLVAISLLTRMSPAIERILEENVFSVEAVEEMLAVLAKAPGDDADRQRFLDALQRARSNVTEDEERAPLATLGEVSGDAVSGDEGARRRAAEALAELGTINRLAMQRADEEAKRLGTAGAWAAALLGLIALLLSIVVLDRARKRILTPVGELMAVVEAQRRGDVHRRAHVPPSTSPELARVAELLDTLLDERERRHRPQAGADPVERGVLLTLLDERDGAWAVVDTTGGLVAANRPAQHMLAGAQGKQLRDALHGASRGQESPLVAECRLLGDTGARMCALAGG